MAQELAEELHLAEVRFIPAANPPHRPHPQSDAHHRVEMIKLAIAGNPIFRLDECELKRGSASYTYDTLTELRHQLGSDRPLCLLIGGDAFLGLTTWYRWQELLDLAHIVVAHRPGAVPTEKTMAAELYALWQDRCCDTLAELHALPAGRIWLHVMTALNISASAIRAMLARDRSPRYLMPDSACDYIRQHHLYQKG